MFEIDKDLNVFSRKSIPSKYIYKDQYKDWMKNLVETYQELIEIYKKFISGDGRLIGIEKNTIKVKLESLLYMLVSLLQSFEEDNKMHTLEESRGQDLNLMFLTLSSYEIRGAVSSLKISQRKNLHQWIHDKLNPMMKSLIGSLGTSLLDGEIIPEEKKRILDEAYDLLTELIYINISIEYTSMTH